jgi:hypothetical protein
LKGFEDGEAGIAEAAGEFERPDAAPFTIVFRFT